MDPFLRTKIDDNIDVFLIILTFNMVFSLEQQKQKNEA